MGKEWFQIWSRIHSNLVHIGRLYAVACFIAAHTHTHTHNRLRLELISNWIASCIKQTNSFCMTLTLFRRWKQSIFVHDNLGEWSFGRRAHIYNIYSVHSMIDAILSVLSKQWISSYYIEKVKLNDIISNIFYYFMLSTPPNGWNVQ